MARNGGKSSQIKGLPFYQTRVPFRREPAQASNTPDSTKILENFIGNIAMPTDEGATKAARRATQGATKAIRRWYEQAPKKRTKLGWIRRFNMLVRSFAADLGGGTLSNADAVLLRQAAAVAIKAEKMQAALLAGQAVTETELTRLTHSVTRVLSVINTKQTKRPSRPYGLADIQAALAAGPDEDDES
jgi:hypothetical protein